MMLAVKCLVLFLGLAAARDTYEGQKVFRITPAIEKEVLFLKEWMPTLDVDMWSEPSAVGHPVDVRVPAFLVTDFEKVLNEQGFEYIIMIADVETAIREQELSNEKNAFLSGFDYNKYNSYNAIVAELRELETKFYAASTFSVGKTYEGRDMIGLKISYPSWLIQEKPAIWIDGGIHAREWISPATTMWFLNKLLTSRDVSVSNLLQKYDFYFLPVFNADGYEYTRSANRMWRKTRSPKTSNCVGADPNRNWDYKFGGAGTSSNPCSDIYHGGRAESEQEVKQVANFLRAIPDLKSYWNIHAYSQLVLTPWSYTTTYPSDYNEIARVAAIFTSNVSKRYGTSYRYGPPSRILYSVAGGSIDWTYAVLGVRYSYALELRDTGRYGFMLPASQIAPTGEETSDALMAAIDAMK